MANVVIIIIAHKANPSRNETRSLLQCQRVLGSHPIVMLCPAGLDVTEYSRVCPNLKFDFIHPEWQSSYGMFNRLKIEPFLYRRYRQYEFILFYELDAWVFKDELEYWCKKDYDFIGAPWFESYDAAGAEAKFLGVGNGGFSLRKTKSHLRALSSFGFVRSPKIIIRELLDNFSAKALIKALASLTVQNNTFFLFNDYRFNEDHFWGKVVAEKYPWFRVPDFRTASRFSMEVNAPYLYELNNGELPFGCHKWEKYQLDFWKPFISVGDPHSAV